MSLSINASAIRKSFACRFALADPGTYNPTTTASESDSNSNKDIEPSPPCSKRVKEGAAPSERGAFASMSGRWIAGPMLAMARTRITA